MTSDDLRALAREEYRDAARTIRSRSFTLPFAAAVVVLAFAPAIPGVGAFAGFGIETSAPVFLGMLAIHLVLVLLERHRPRAYVAGDAFETAFHVAAYGWLILRSGRALAVPWFFLSMNAQMVGLHPWPAVHRTAYVVMPLVVAFVFERRGQRDDALLSLVLGVALLIILRVATAGTLERLRSRLRIGELERQIERSRIARELHDGIGADLTAVILRARTLAESASGAEREGLEALATRTRATLAELRSVVWAAHEASVSFDGLVEQLRRRAAELVPLPMQCSVEAEVPGDEVVSGELSVLVLRLVQESVNNAARHANASTVLVRVQKREATLAVEIADDGRFRTPEAAGHGLANLRHRVERAGGTFELTASDAGTTLRAELPFL